MNIPEMTIPDYQEVVLVWNEKPIGKIFSKNVRTSEGTYTITWRGECLGEKIQTTSYGEAVKRMMMIADKRNLQMVQVRQGYGIDTLYTPAFEE